ncbi:MAG TPA: 23S rRNA (adenine(2503)-C(2))-methyltransferase RlmN [Planctomycetota bacterium]|nr:23S rRNA (adenine(2503)-C(2))-methyltransferase RlmN [Planctomycetota bacterium]
MTRGILALEPAALARAVVEAGGRPFHAASIRRWILERSVADFARMTDLPRALVAALRDSLAPLESQVAARTDAPDGTTKLLLRLADGHTIETVRMPGAKGGSATVCVSTQVGCAVACRFCASGLAGIVRNLAPHEIVEQLVHARALGPVGRIVVMGIGEPTLNLDAVLAALDVATDPAGLGLSARKVTISTVGVPAGIARLAEIEKPFNLAISLHAPDDALRRELIPTAKVGIDDLVAAARAYFERSHREPTFEYVLLRGVNDRPEQARELARRLRGVRGGVNLIPYNPIPGSPYERPDDERVRAFRDALRRAGVVATVRWSKGLEAEAACGQLRIAERSGDPSPARPGSAGIAAPVVPPRDPASPGSPPPQGSAAASRAPAP